MPNLTKQEKSMTHEAPALAHPIAVIGDQAKCLTEIFREQVNLTIWNRPLEARIKSFVAELTARAGKLERFIILSEDDDATTVLPKWALEIDGAQAWMADLDKLIDMYRCLFEPQAVGLRLHVLQGTMCPRFHTDRVPVRLLCTYQGVGTEWLHEEQVTRPQGDGP